MITNGARGWGGICTPPEVLQYYNPRKHWGFLRFEVLHEVLQGATGYYRAWSQSPKSKVQPRGSIQPRKHSGFSPEVGLKRFKKVGAGKTARMRDGFEGRPRFPRQGAKG